MARGERGQRQPPDRQRYRIAEYRAEFESEVARLLGTLRGLSRRVNRDYFRWKYLANPFGDEPLVYLGLDEQDRVVGMRGFYLSRWSDPSGGARLVIPCAADSIIESAHRDRGLFAELNNFAFADLERRGFTHALNLTPTPANYVVSVLTMGWKPLGSHDVWQHSSAMAQTVSRAAPRLHQQPAVRRGLAVARRVRATVGWSPFRRLDKQDLAVDVRSQPLPEAMAELASRASEANQLRPTKDPAFFSWRFQNPRARYRFLFKGGDALQGYLVLGNVAGQSRVFVVDWEAADGDIEADLFTAVLKCGFGNLRVWAGGLDGATRHRLDDVGFRPVPALAPHADRILVRRIGPEEEADWKVGDLDLRRMTSWDLGLLTSDVH